MEEIFEGGVVSRNNGENTNNMENEEYVDRFGKIWRFQGRAQNEEQLHQLSQQNWLTKGETTKSTIPFVCRRRRFHRCKFRAIYEKKSGTLFIRGAHSHPLVEVERGNNYVDQFGKVWQFHGRAQGEEQLRELCHQNWLTKKEAYKSTIYCVCKRYIPDKCKFRGIYENKSGSLYVRGEHSHPMVAGKILRTKPGNFGDRYGRELRFVAKFDCESKLLHFYRQNWLQQRGKSANKIYFACRCGVTAYRNSHPPPYCQLHAVYNRADTSFYFIGQHNHPMPRLTPEQAAEKELKEDQDEGGEKEKVEESEEEMMEDDDEGDEEEPEEYDGEEEEGDGQMEDEEQDEDEGEGEDHRIIQSTELDGNEEEDEEEPDYMDNNGVLWHFMARVKDEQFLSKLCQEHWLTRQHRGIERITFVCKRTAWVTHNRHNCKLRAVYVKKFGGIYVRGEHNHPTEPID